MIDPSFADTITPYPPTIQELERRVGESYTEIQRLTSEVENLTSDRNFWQTKAHERMIMIDNLEEWIKEQHDYLDEDIVLSLVGIFGLDLTKEYDVQVTVTFSGSVTVPHDFNMDNLDQYISASMDFYGDPDISNGYIEEFDISVDWTEK